MMLGAYTLATRALAPAISLYLKRRLARGKEDPVRFGERMGRAGLPRPAGPLVWLHGASVGEALSILGLVADLRRRAFSVLVTTGTVTSARLLADRLPAGAIHQFVPVDRPDWVAAFLDHWRPDLAIWTESDFWPNLMLAVQARQVPMVLVQGRMSEQSRARWSRAPAAIKTLLGGFALTLAQTAADADRLRALGAVDCRCLGNLKLSQPPLPCDDDTLDGLRAELGGAPCWLAASTHDGEEMLAARVHRHLEPTLPGLVTVIVPRHPERGPAIAAALAAAGMTISRRSAGQALAPGIHLADTLGELGLFYRLAPVVFVGKSMTARGGQNPFEPARLGAAVLVGPHMDNFAAMTASMLATGAGALVADADALADAVGRLLTDPVQLAARRAAAHDWALAQAGALDAVLTALAPLLERLDHAGA